MQFETISHCDKFKSFIQLSGYKKYIQNIDHEDYAYWKKFNDKYQVGLLFYDLSKYDPKFKISVMFKCMLLNRDDRIDMIVSSDTISLSKFEEMAHKFAETFNEK